MEELLAPIPFDRHRVRPATHVRSTWLASSLRGVKERGLFDAYHKLLPIEHRDAVLNSVAGMWIPIEVGAAHYWACDGLGLTQQDQIDLGQETSRWIRGAMFSVLTRMAKEAGVGPFNVVPLIPKFWERSVQGGAMATYKLGPKEARVDYLGFPWARIPYVRVAQRGIVLGVFEPFARVVYVREVTPLCSDMSLSYRISWA